MSDSFESWLAERPKDGLDEDCGLLKGTRVGEYRIVARLGRGGFAEVYRAEDDEGRPVAIKMLHRLDDKSRARFERESQILSRVRHPNMPRLLGFGSCGNRPYMVTELLRPCELPRRGRQVADFLRKVGAAVQALHENGYVHRDIKPANVLMRGEGEPVLIDFGLACPISKLRREREALSEESGTKVAVGTPGYSAPEQFSGQGAGPEADVHALGALIGDCFGERMPKCWRKIYLSATNSNPKVRYHSIAAFNKAIRYRHFQRFLWCTVGLLLLVALAVYVWNGMDDYYTEKRMPRQFREADY